MKVLKKPATWETRQVACQGSKESCGAVLEIEFSDLRRTHYDGTQQEQAWDQIFVTCPECGRTIDVRDIPQHLVQKIPDRRTV
jgi:hypothetical protein